MFVEKVREGEEKVQREIVCLYCALILLLCLMFFSTQEVPLLVFSCLGCGTSKFKFG